MVDKDVRLEGQKPSLEKQYLSVTINEAILTFLYNQGYRVGSKVGLSFIQRVEFQTNKRLYGDEKTQSETTRGKKDHRVLQTEDHKREREKCQQCLCPLSQLAKICRSGWRIHDWSG